MRWRRRIDAFDPATESLSSFCEREGVSTSSFCLWRHRLRPTTISNSGFRPIVVATAQASQSPCPPWGERTLPLGAAAKVRARLPDGVVVELPADQPGLVLSVVTALAASRREATS